MQASLFDCSHGPWCSSSMRCTPLPQKDEARKMVGSSCRLFAFTSPRHSQLSLPQSTIFTEARCPDRRCRVSCLGVYARKCHRRSKMQPSHLSNTSWRHSEEARKTVESLFPSIETTARQCICSVSMAELGSGAAALEWRSAVDNLLLLSSIALACVAGIVTPLRDHTFVADSRREKASERTSSTSSEESGKWENTAKETAEVHFNAKDVWSHVRQKLNSSYFGQDGEDIFQSPVLSLQALAKGPRLRLLFLTLEQLHKKVDKLREGSIVSESGWIELCSTLLCQTVVSICRIWLAQEDLFEEQNLTSTNIDRLELNSFPELQTVKDNDMMIDYLMKSGKSELYADFLHFICFASVRYGSCCKLNMLSKYAEAILEDMIITVANGVTVLYLDLLSAVNIQVDLPSVTISELSSTRTLERFRNEVAIRAWIHENFESVTAMFEDYFLLWTLKRHNFQKRRPTSNGYLRWLINECTGQNTGETEGSELLLSRFEMPAKRIRELRALSGWKYYYSLYLEFSDVTGPLLRTVIRKLGEGLSLLLVCFIGRSLGLIYKGIRQSIGWTSD